MNATDTYFGVLRRPVAVNPIDNDEVMVELESSSDTLVLQRNEERFSMWSSWLQDAYGERKPVYIVARKQDRVIQDIRLVGLRRVDSLAMSADKQQLKVGMLPSPSYYHVPVSNPRFKDIRETLQQSLDTKKQIYIVLGGPLEIVDVRVPDAGWSSK